MSLEDEKAGGHGEAPVIKYSPFNVSKDLLNRARAGDQNAFTELDLAVRPRRKI